MGTQSEIQLFRLREMGDEQFGDCFALLQAKELKKTRAGDPYYLLRFSDQNRTVSVMVWNNSDWFSPCTHEWQVGDFFKLRGTFRNTDWGGQFDLTRIRQAGSEDESLGFSPSDFVRGSRFPAAEMFDQLLELIRTHISNTAIREVVEKILNDNRGAIEQIPAATHNHHAYQGGYLEHVLSVTRTAIHFVDKYSSYYSDLDPPISRSIVVAGAILHDIGKLTELDYNGACTEYSVPGRLLGHMVLGRDILREAAHNAEIDPHDLLMLEHIIGAHQGRKEWGAVVEPQTLECLLVHFADDLDAKVNMMVEALQSDQGDDRFTGRNNPLRRRVYRGTHGASPRATND